MSNSKKLFSKLKMLEVPLDVHVGDGHPLKGIGKGSIKMAITNSSGVVNKIKLKNVLFVPELSYNLFSVASAVKSGKYVNFYQDECQVIDEDLKVLFTGNKKGNLFYLNLTSQTESIPEIEDKTEEVNIVNEEMKSKEDVWHQRYGHLGVDNLKKLAVENLVEGFNFNVSTCGIRFCEDCVHGKIHRHKFPNKGGSRAAEKLDLVHSDVCGKIEVKSMSHKEYFLSFVDDKTRYSWTYTIKKKSEVYDTFMEWKAMVERECGRKLKKLRSDNGGEYTSNEFETKFKEEGMKHQLTVPKTPEQNGVAERLNRKLMEIVRSMLSQSGLPKCFWAEALSPATYLRNRSPTSAVIGMTPFEAWNGIKPNVSHLKTFGSICYSHIPKDERKKLDFKARKAIFVGYGTEIKGYRLFDPQLRKAYYSRDVVFNEGCFQKDDKLVYDDKSSLVDENDSTNDVPLVINVQKEMTSDELAIPNTWMNINDSKDEVQNNPELEKEIASDEPIEMELPQNDIDETVNTLRRSSRPRKIPNAYGEWVNITRDSRNMEPKSFKEAMSDDNREGWMKAMSEEMKSLKKNCVWELVTLPAGRRAIGCKWVYKSKVNEDGLVDRLKARLVAQGYNQKHGIDYDETFSPVARFESIRTVIGIAAHFKLKLHQMDVKTAFLNGELKEQIYMRQPEGFTSENSSLVCLLNRSIYGLKQSARCWNTELHALLKEMGFEQLNSDACIYIHKTDKSIIAIYVDDIILACLKDSTMTCLKKRITEKFDVEDMGELHYFLGVKIEQNHENATIWIGQPSYIKDILNKFSMEDCKPINTPVDVSSKLVKCISNDKQCSKELYQSAVGSLLYVSTRTRPDIAYAIGNLAKYCSQPSLSHWTAVKRVLRYLKGTVNLGLSYHSCEALTLNGYSDADWAGELDTRKSTSGYIFMINNVAVSWRSKLQSCVALSTAEAEYMALASAAQEAIWMQKLMLELGQQEDGIRPTIVYEDNQSAISMSKNPQFHGRTKHIDIKHPFIREKVIENTIKLEYCKSEEMPADILTKALNAPQFMKLRNKLGLVNNS